MHHVSDRFLPGPKHEITKLIYLAMLLPVLTLDSSDIFLKARDFIKTGITY